MNLFPEATESSPGSKRAFLYGTPGRRPLFRLPDVGCRGNWSQDGLSVSVVGDGLYRLDVSGPSWTYIGAVQNDNQLVSFASNGHGGEQLALVSGGALYIYGITTGILSNAITLPLSNAPMQVDFIDGYFLLSEKDSLRVWFSSSEDGTVWDALDFFAKSVNSDNIIAIKAWRGRVWLFGSISTVLYYDSGDADNPFVPYSGAIIQQGIVCWPSLLTGGESLYWLGRNENGTAQFMTDNNYSPVPISTPPISFALNSYPTLADVEGLDYSQEGHEFVIWTCPSGDETWAYDIREQQWHQRDAWDANQGISHHWRVRGCALMGSLVIVGDWQSGDISVLDMDTFDDNGDLIMRRRRAPYLSQENQWLFIDRVEMGAQVGVGLTDGQGDDPELFLRISRDAGQTWDPAISTSVGKLGEYGQMATWWQLGRARADRFVIDISQSDPVRTAWGPGLWLRARAGTGAV